MNPDRFRWAASLVALLLNSMLPTALAQAAPPDAGQILNEQQRVVPRPGQRLPQPEGQQQELPPPTPGALKVLIRAVRFVGGEDLASESELQAQVSDAIGKEIDYAGLQQLADRITRYLKSKGYPLAQAYLPVQALEEGRLEIAIRPGVFDDSGIDIRADGLRLNADIVRGTVLGAVTRDGTRTPIRTDNLERGLLLLNDMPGVSARATLEPGAYPGTSRLVVRMEEGPLLTGSIWGDNYGNRYSGKWRVNAQTVFNDPLQIGDQATLGLVHARNLDQADLSYRLPVCCHGLQLAVDVGFLDYRIGEELSNLDANGTVSTVRLNAAYPLIRTRDRNLYVSLSYEARQLKDDILGFRVHDKRIDFANVGLNGSLADGLGAGGVTTFSSSLTLGRLDLSGNAADLAGDQASAKTNGHYDKANISVSRLQRLTDTVSLAATGLAQFAGKNMDSSEKFMLGGPNGVRAYPVGEGSGDSGWLASLEVRRDLPGIAAFDTLQMIGFVDTGSVLQHRYSWIGAVTNAGNANRYILSAAGIGLAATARRDFALRLVLAAPIGSNPGRSATTGRNADGRSDHVQIWGQVVSAF